MNTVEVTLEVESFEDTSEFLEFIEDVALIVANDTTESMANIGMVYETLAVYGEQRSDLNASDVEKLVAQQSHLVRSTVDVVASTTDEADSQMQVLSQGMFIHNTVLVNDYDLRL